MSASPVATSTPSTARALAQSMLATASPCRICSGRWKGARAVALPQSTEVIHTIARRMDCGWTKQCATALEHERLPLGSRCPHRHRQQYCHQQHHPMCARTMMSILTKWCWSHWQPTKPCCAPKSGVWAWQWSILAVAPRILPLFRRCALPYHCLGYGRQSLFARYCRGTSCPF